MLDRMESNNLLEEIEHASSEIRIREIRHRGRTRPRNDRDKQDSNDDRALDAVHHQQCGQEATAEDTNPHSRIAHLPTAFTKPSILVKCNASSQLNGSIRSALDESNSGAVSQADQSKIQPDANTSRKLDRSRECAREPLPHTDQCQTQEDPALDEYGSQRNPVRNQTGTMLANNGVCKVGIETHARSQRDGQVRKEAHAEGREGGDGCCRGNNVALDFLHANQVFGIGRAVVRLALSRADACPASRRSDGGVHGDDIGHGEERGQTGAKLGEEEAPLPFQWLVRHDITLFKCFMISPAGQGSMKTHVTGIL